MSLMTALTPAITMHLMSLIQSFPTCDRSILGGRCGEQLVTFPDGLYCLWLYETYTQSSPAIRITTNPPISSLHISLQILVLLQSTASFYPSVSLLPPTLSSPKASLAYFCFLNHSNPKCFSPYLSFVFLLSALQNNSCEIPLRGNKYICRCMPFKQHQRRHRPTQALCSSLLPFI